MNNLQSTHNVLHNPHKDQIDIEPEIAQNIIFYKECFSVIFNKFKTNRNVKDFLFYVAGLLPDTFGDDILQQLRIIPNKTTKELLDHKAIEASLYQSINDCIKFLQKSTEHSFSQEMALLALHMLEKKYSDISF